MDLLLKPAEEGVIEGVIAPTPLYGTEEWGMRSAERRKVNVLEFDKFGWSVSNG